jgi:hypothetical protein
MSDDIEVDGVIYRRDDDWFRDIARELRADAPVSPSTRKPRKRKAPTLASVANQASKAGIPVARYEVEPSGKINVVTGKPESSTVSNPWLDDLKVTKQ